MKYIILSILSCWLLAIPTKAQTSEDTKDIAPTLPADSMALSVPYPQFNMIGISPLGYGYANWELHKGLNASFGMNITFSPSKYAPSGVGFGQDATFLYVQPLSKRLSVAGGLYASNMNWGYYNRRNVGITGIAGYQLTERISLYAYGNKNLTPDYRNGYPYPLHYFDADKIGGMVNFKLGNAASFSVGVERISYPAR